MAKGKEDARVEERRKIKGPNVEAVFADGDKDLEGPGNRKKPDQRVAAVQSTGADVAGASHDEPERRIKD